MKLKRRRSLATRNTPLTRHHEAPSQPRALRARLLGVFIRDLSVRDLSVRDLSVRDRTCSVVNNNPFINLTSTYILIQPT